MPTIAKKSGVEISGSMPFTAKGPDIASASVPDTLAALRVNPEIGLTRAQVDYRKKRPPISSSRDC